MANSVLCNHQERLRERFRNVRRLHLQWLHYQDYHLQVLRRCNGLHQPVPEDWASSLHRLEKEGGLSALFVLAWCLGSYPRRPAGRNIMTHAKRKVKTFSKNFSKIFASRNCVDCVVIDQGLDRARCTVYYVIIKRG